MSSLLRNPTVRADAFELAPPTPFVPRVVGATPEEVERVRREAYAAGVASARAEQAEESARLRAETARAVEALTRAVSEIATARGAMLEEAAEQVIGLAADVARRIVRRELVLDTEAVLPLVRELLTRVAAAERIVVRLSPSDVQVARDLLERSSELPRGARVIVDPRLSTGDCVVETEVGNLDGRIETQLARIEAALDVRRSTEASEPADEGDPRPGEAAA